MSGGQEVTYNVDFAVGRKDSKNKALSPRAFAAEAAGYPVARIARLIALAIRFEGLLREEKIQDYAELARLGRVTRARITQIMKLLHLAPDLQERLLFLPPMRGLNERNLRLLVSRIDWREQRRLFQKIIDRLPANDSTKVPSGADC